MVLKSSALPLRKMFVGLSLVKVKEILGGFGMVY
jgi:hypothetical protein